MTLVERNHKAAGGVDLMGTLRVHYGCGLSASNEWRNFDASPTLRLSRIPVIGGVLTRHRAVFPSNVEYGDIVRGLPIGDASSEAVYCSHVLEHLSLEDFRRALRETYRLLRPRGTFRGVLPDLEIIVQQYIADTSHEAAIRFMNSTMLGVTVRKMGVNGVIENSFGNSRHLWMWDFKGLAKELADAGFRDIRRAQFGDNPLPYFAQVEDEDRWRDCLGFECKR